MTLTVEVPENLEAALQARAQAQGISAAGFVRQVLQQALASAAGDDKTDQPFETGYGMLAKYGPAPSAAEIDENRRDMFRNFAQDC